MATIAGAATTAAYLVPASPWHLHRAALVAAWLVFAATVIPLTVRPRPRRGRFAVPVVIAAAALAQLPGLLQPPQTSDDAYRYAWDGRVQLSGTSPYRYVPLDDALAPLRDPLLFPGLRPGDPSGVHGPGPATADPRTRINRPLVPTIYPPVAQVWFAGVAAVTPDRAGTLGLQLGAAAVAVATAALLATALARRRRDPFGALVFALCPAVAVEAAGNAHVDVLATLLLVAALLAVRRPWLTGLLLGLAAGVKIVPLLLLPAVPRVRNRFVALGTFLAGYLPHLLVVGWLVLGYLPGYLAEEGFDSGRSRYAVLATVLPEPARAAAALLLGGALAAVAWRRATPATAAGTATWLLGAALLVATPTYPWYTLPLLGLAVLSGRLEWIAVVVAAYVGYEVYARPGLVGAGYLVATLVVVAAAVRRSRPSRSST